MKRTYTILNLPVYLLASLVLISFTACNPLKKMAKNLNTVKTTVEDNVLEVHADSINVNFITSIPPKYFKKKAILKLEPMLVYSKDSIPMPPLYIAGEKVDFEANKIPAKNVIAYKKGGQIEYKKRLKYDPDMKNSAIFIVTSYKLDSEYDELDQCICDIRKEKIADGVIATSQTVKPTEDILTAGSIVTEKVSASATMFYDINKADIKKTEGEKAEVDRIKKMVLDINNKVDAMYLNSSASPDGTIELNTKLAESRKAASYKYMISELKRLGLKTIYDSAFYKRSTTSEDWAGMRDLIAQSDISIRQDVLKIIESDLALDQKEAAIRKLGQWDYLASAVLPKLRKTTITLSGEIALRPINELQKLYQENKLDQLTGKNELLYLAFNQTEITKQMELFQRYAQKYPEGYVGKNNVAYAYLKMGDVENAAKILRPLYEKFPNSKEVANNMGVCYIRKGQYDSALTLYQRAETLGAMEKNNIGIVYIKKGQYDKAVESFESNRFDYNRALAYTLKKDFDGAKKVIESIDNKIADDFYLRAIIGARTKDIDLMTTSLTRAVRLDESIRTRAKEDFEFRNYWNTDEFKNAIR